MQRYYLKVSGQSIRQAQVMTNATPLRTEENALNLYLKEPRKADKHIPLVLQPLNKKLQSALVYKMIDVNDYMEICLECNDADIGS